MTSRIILLCGLLVGCKTDSEPKDTNQQDTGTQDTGETDPQPDLFTDEECGLRWPADPFHAAVYGYVAEYVLGAGAAVGCFLDYYPDQTHGSIAEEMEENLQMGGAVANLEAAQQWVDDNAATHGQSPFDLIEVFQLVVDGNTVSGGLGYGEPSEPDEPNDCGEDTWEDEAQLESYFTIQANPDTDAPGMECLTRYVDVLGLSIYAEGGFTNAQVLHAAAVFAELLDNDEDGVVDDQALYDQLLSVNAMMPMFNQEGSPGYNDFIYNYQGSGVSAVLFAEEVDPTQPGHWGADATVEEIMHTINHRGHVAVYPEAFAIDPDSSLLSAAMDVARGGQYLTVPSSYPEESWYHYDDVTCDYGCMAIEYIYWAQVSLMGILDDPQTCSGIANEWELCTPELLQDTDVLVYELLTDPQYKLPHHAPDGNYTPTSD